MQLDLHGALDGTLAGLLWLSLGGEGKPRQQETSCELEVMQSIVFMVAGVGFEPTTFRL